MGFVKKGTTFLNAKLPNPYRTLCESRVTEQSPGFSTFLPPIHPPKTNHPSTITMLAL